MRRTGTWGALWDDLRMILAGRFMDLALRVAPRNNDGVLLAWYIGSWSKASAEQLERRIAAMVAERAARRHRV